MATEQMMQQLQDLLDVNPDLPGLQPNSGLPGSGSGAGTRQDLAGRRRALTLRVTCVLFGKSPWKPPPKTQAADRRGVCWNLSSAPASPGVRATSRFWNRVCVRKTERAWWGGCHDPLQMGQWGQRSPCSQRGAASEEM